MSYEMLFLSFDSYKDILFLYKDYSITDYYYYYNGC